MSSLRMGLLGLTLFANVLLVSTIQTMVVPILGRLESGLGESGSTISWVVIAGLLSGAVFTPLLSRLGDLRGRRGLLLAVLLMVVAGCAVAALTSSIELLVLSRGLQGLSFALIPLSIGILREELAPRFLNAALALVSGALALGTGVGFAGTGLLTVDGDYHRVFWACGLLALVLLLTTAAITPSRPRSAEGSIDWWGAVLLAGTLTFLLLAVSQGSTWGWTAPRTLGCLGLSGVSGVLWVSVEGRVPAPMVQLSTLRRRNVAVGNAMGVLIGLAAFICYLGVSAFVQSSPARSGYGFNATVLSSGVSYLLPGALAGVASALVGGPLINLLGSRLILAMSAGVGVAGYAFMAVLHIRSWQILTGEMAVNVALTLMVAAVLAVVVEDVGLGETSVATGFNSICRSTGSSLASALLALMLDQRLGDAGGASEHAYVVVFAIGAGAFLIVGLLAWVGLSRRVLMAIDAELPVNSTAY